MGLSVAAAAAAALLNTTFRLLGSQRFSYGARSGHRNPRDKRSRVLAALLNVILYPVFLGIPVAGTLSNGGTQSIDDVLLIAVLTGTAVFGRSRACR